MRDNTASRTARGVAAHRLDYARIETPYGDPAADEALARGRPVGLVVVEPPDQATWISGMTRPGLTAYLQSMFIRPEQRGSGTGAALVRHVHAALDARGIDLTLLHYAQLNPLSAPFWHRMGYRPLWSTWEALPASTLR